MIKKYQYFSKGFNSNVVLWYRDGLLLKVEVENPLPENVKDPKSYYINHEENFLKMCRAHKIQYTEMEREISFEMFWDRYGYKVDKEPARKSWLKLSPTEQIQAYDFIPTYESQLKQSQLAKKYPVTYLNKKTFIK